jgi:hypothetical protein
MWELRMKTFSINALRTPFSHFRYIEVKIGSKERLFPNSVVFNHGQQKLIKSSQAIVPPHTPCTSRCIKRQNKKAFDSYIVKRMLRNFSWMLDQHACQRIHDHAKNIAYVHAFTSTIHKKEVHKNLQEVFIRIHFSKRPISDKSVQRNFVEHRTES